MKLLMIAVCATALFACNNQAANTETASNDTSNATTASTDAGTKTKEWVPVDDSTAMKAMMEAGTPGKEQAILAESNGKWTADVSMWYAPGTEPVKSKATVSNKMIYGGRFQQADFKGSMMDQPFEGTSITGYDKARKVWVATWIDNLTTTITTMEGTYDEATKTTTLTGKMLCPNGQEAEMKQVTRKIDDKTEIMEMYCPDLKTGKPYKNMEMKLTRN